MFLALHNRSEGRSTFALDETGRVAITVQLSNLDLPELCNADFSVRDREGEERKLDECLFKNFTRWIRVHGDNSACVVALGGWKENAGTVVIDAKATCPAMPNTLVIDWGLFAGSPLDHVSVATVTQPHAKPRLAMLSKRANKLTVDVAGPKWPFVIAGALVMTALGVLLAFVMKRRLSSRGETA
jgi:hypothetical protein